MKRLIWFFAVAVLCASAAFSVPPDGPPIVSVSARVTESELRPGEDFVLEVTASVREGFHVSADHPDSRYPPVLKIDAPTAAKFGKPQFPRPRLIELSFAPGRTYPVYDGEFVIRVKGQVRGDAVPQKLTIRASLETQPCAYDRCLPPEIAKAEVSVDVVAGKAAGAVSSGPAGQAQDPGAEKDDIFGRLAGKALVLQLALLYGLGFLLALTPCVYPMIPVTVGYFASQTGERRTGRVVALAAVYVLGLAFTYSLMGVAAAATGGVFGAAMQKPTVLGAIALILIALALSMFGLYELRPPAFILNRSAARAGVLGALTMGLIFGLVAIPCVGPAVVGVLAYAAHLGNPVMGFLLFFALALGIGTPLFALAAFSAVLPAPGAWMLTVKRLGGFLLLVAAAYFLQNVVPKAAASYLIPVVVLAAVVYFGFFDRNLIALRGFARALRNLAIAAAAVALMIIWPKPHSGPAVTWEPYSPAAVESAVAEKRPVMLKFTADWCGVCREMEHGPLRDPGVVKEADRFVRLRVDGTGPVLSDEVKQAHAEHRVRGYPTIVILDSQGKPAERLEGYADAGVLLEAMRAVR